MTTILLRRRAGQRISAALWGLLVMGAGALSMVAYSGYSVDIQLAFIILLAAVGAWLLLSAAVSGIGRKKEVAAATAPTVEEPADARVTEADKAPVSETVTEAEAEAEVDADLEADTEEPDSPKP